MLINLAINGLFCFGLYKLYVALGLSPNPYIHVASYALGVLIYFIFLH
jgi:hypothetical protein